MKAFFWCLIISALLFAAAEAQEIAQWRGMERNGKYSEEGLLKQWPQNGPDLIWSAEELGEGYSSASITEDALYITGMKKRTEYLTALNHQGKVLWQIPYGRAWNKSNPEARCTPAVENNRVYVISGLGDIACIDAVNKEKIWTIEGFEEYEGKCGRWGVAESPLIVDDYLIYTPAGDKTTMVAQNKHTGKTEWMSKSLNDISAYVSPLLVLHGNKKIIVSATANYVFGVNADNGEMLWSHRYTDIDKPTWHADAPIINANTPLYHNGHIYVTSGYDHVGVMYKLSEDGSDIQFAWKDATLDTHHGGVVLVNGCIYGSNWDSNRMGYWCCIDWNTGETKYQKEWRCKGSIITADDMLYCYEERTGYVALVKATPDDFEIVSEFKIEKGEGHHWAHPVIHKGRLYIRHGEVLMAYNIKSDELKVSALSHRASYITGKTEMFLQ